MTQPHANPIPGMSDAFDFVRNLWGAMSVPGLATPTLSVEELDKRIADLKAVEAWISMNATMLRGTIHTLEVQRATIATLKSMGSSLAEAMPHAASAGAQAGGQAGAHQGLADSAAAWWDMLQQQFGNVLSGALNAAATPATQGEPTAAPGEKPKSAGPRGAGARTAKAGTAKPRKAAAKPGAAKARPSGRTTTR